MNINGRLNRIEQAILPQGDCCHHCGWPHNAATYAELESCGGCDACGRMIRSDGRPLAPLCKMYIGIDTSKM